MRDMLDNLFDDDKPTVDESEIPVESTLLMNCPNITAMMCWETFKAKPREKATLSCFLGVGAWGVRLVDHDNRRSFAMEGPSILAAVDSLERLISTGKVNWYRWPDSNGRGKKKSVGK